MPAADVAGALRLPPRVDAAVAATLFREVAPRAAHVIAIDFSVVESIDSAGLALVRTLCERAAKNGAAPALLHVPPRYRQLCLAHRVEPGETSA